ncbi:MAG: phospho-N-acetylmuramoyl-pentapeptide-transferase [Phycisphaeraceae bacterium]|nr:phospho-N-acetylmuramoyl-pentapeptide-transferase [Phycisphaeraceae bacterium]
MLHWLIELLRPTIDSGGFLSPLRVFRYVEFRAVVAIVVSFAIVVLSGKRTIRWLLARKIGDQPEFYHKDLNQLMKTKANTPTMGGILIVASIFITVLLLADLGSFYIRMAMVCMGGFFAIGAIDDWLKLTSARRAPGSGRREGLYTWEKLVYQVGLALLLGIFIFYWGYQKRPLELDEIKQMSHALNLPLLKSWVFVDGRWEPSPNLIVLGTGAFVLLAVIVIVGASNAVNLTDGMDGLAGGVMAIVAFAFVVLCIIAGYEDGNFVLAKKLLVPFIPLADELAIVAGAMVGSCLGFLWFNCSPAQVFMGDSGSLTLGGLIGFIAVVIRQEFLLLMIGGIFATEALSVILQVAYFKLTGGKRIFKCAPIHHHFHLLGWTEQQVVVRFWLITALLAAAALATIKLR